MCKCNHNNTLLYNSTQLTQPNSYSIETIAYMENIKHGTQNLHGFEGINYIHQPPKF
jgi:hypothetical protein